MTEQTSVMIIESQSMMRTALSTALSADGMTVLAEIADSRDALQTASQLSPNLILFSIDDLDSKDMTRISALRRMLAQTTVVALITGEVSGQDQLALDYGAHLVLTKSTPRSELLNAIRSMPKKEIYPATMQVN